VGGDLLTIESALLPGSGMIKSTGRLGEVMKESIHAAETVVKSRARQLGITRKFIRKHNVHIHVPEGAIPKDGPSAGIGMVTVMVSAMTGTPVLADVAMTGEITLRGEVLPIGGLKEKLLAAHRGGIKRVLIPKDNEKDLAEVPDSIKNGLEIKAVKWIDEVLALALERAPTPLRDDEDIEDDAEMQPPQTPVNTDEDSEPARTH
jgi:ATP-dependent Lon protease